MVLVFIQILTTGLRWYTMGRISIYNRFVSKYLHKEKLLC